MIIGYQVQDKHGSNWANRPSYEILTEKTAERELVQARKKFSDDNYNMITILQGDIEQPTFEENNMVSINGDQELLSLAEEFEGEIELSNPTDIATLAAISAARNLIQKSTNNYTIIIPNNVSTLWAGDGSGEWLPAMVFVPNSELF